MIRRLYIIFFIVVLQCAAATAQWGCPPNIGFESGNFDQWECLTGYFTQNGQPLNLIPGPPSGGRHTIIQPGPLPVVDPYGGFPIVCPNGSRYSVKLGNEFAGAQAEAIYYTFTVPVDKDDYSIIYNYAVVFQNPNHSLHEQPRFTSRVFDVTDNKYIECASFEFVASAGLPGFQESPNMANVFYKPWSPITINLFGYAGKTIRLEFTNNDCTLGAHFGYAYLDVNENCISPISGNYFCGLDSIRLEAPKGFNMYNWYTPDFQTKLGTDDWLTLRPLPPAGTQYVLEIIPFPGLGCRDTLTTTIRFPSEPLDLIAKDSLIACEDKGADLTSPSVVAGSSSNLAYTYYMDPAGATLIPLPEKITKSGTYYIKAMNIEACYKFKPVVVDIRKLPQINVNDPPTVYFPATVDLTDPSITSGSDAGLVYTYWRDGGGNNILPSASTIGETGTYFIRGMNASGCISFKSVKVTVMPPPPPNIKVPNAFSPNNDGINDLFRIEIPLTMSVTRLSIYNRYGVAVFRTTDITRYWDGKDVPVGTYYWVLEGVELYGEKKMIRSGSVTVVR
ncbi:MAG TPA: gliding motility-associated C-terminal domain-containing protein [Chitinophagaceae bacterium]|nr:gliding motility-associated C-terminal domain-containing protein [Chitinophagaceae bacterium]